ncbi:glycoside hydrolase family 32 protein [Cellulomonas cellasea]|uniref:Levanase n=1 Tax=Cellulomonas cellasea TaxID=43670 RepID=A0A7W4YB94_9CELL|nr:glycoside hydrolase family 32 protein [Cellulomonas cellasea]MBB2922794.1 levanase [Cellulomonas cellasea]
MGRRTLRLLCGVIALTSAVPLPASAAPGPSPSGSSARAFEAPARYAAVTDPFRPELHFAPQQNWVNDPNGPVWYDGEYHLFFQHNPEGTQWGHMSWGHAVSTDLVHWEERPVAIPWSEREHIFSGSVVVDSRGTSGWGTPEEPAMVAVYTSWDPVTGIQAQSVAYSTDRGESWTKHAGNPVLDLGSREFRDPRVLWFEEGGYWVMAVAMAVDRTIAFYRSDDLLAWSHLSDFGPANAVGGVWEMPDLFELPVEGRPGESRWVLVVNLNPGAVAGGSGAQYFLGHFDGTRFTSETVVTGEEDPSGTVLADFDGGYGPGWVTTGTAFGTAPATGTLPGQQAVTGFRGSGLVNSFLDQDRAQGTLTSPPFTLTEDYVNVLVGGGDHPRRPGAGDGSAPEGTVLADFEGDGFGDWTVTGDAFGTGPTRGNAPCQVGVTGYLGGGLAGSYRSATPDDCSVPPDTGTGTLTSPELTITERWLSFLVGGGAQPETAVRLLVDGAVVRTASGSESGTLDWVSWDLADLQGRRARIEVRDAATGGWGHVMADAFVASAEPARPRAAEATVNLVVDGDVVRTATGQDSEVLDWVAWDVRGLAGRQAQLRVVDSVSGGWGHVLADQVTLSDVPARSLLERYRWLDHGTDFYAALTFENVPDGRRIAVAWMNNWEYASATPTGSWRGAMTFPRELTLRDVGGELRLTQEPVEELAAQPTTAAPYVLRDRVVREGVTALPRQARGAVLAIDAELEVGTADRVGLHVRTGTGERTVVGYDVHRERLFVDRTASGDVDFHEAFAGVHAAPLPAPDGRVRIRVLVDRSSVEVIGGGGEVALTDLVYPALTSDGVALFAEGGEARVRSLTVRPLG